MENQFEKKNTEVVHTGKRKNEISLPLLAVCLSLAPFFLISFSSFLHFSLSSLVILFAVILPIGGLVTGVVSLCKGKKRIGTVGMIFSIAAIAVPLSIIILVIIFFVGASTGIIALM